MIDKMMDTMANFMNGAAQWLTMPTLPWNRLRDSWKEFIDMIAPWNKVFPLTDLMIIVGLVLGVAAALIAFYVVVLVKSFIPFLGGK